MLLDLLALVEIPDLGRDVLTFERLVDGTDIEVRQHFINCGEVDNLYVLGINYVVLHTK